LDASVFNGAAGVGLFLARCGSLCGDAEVKRTAAGALAGALARADNVQPAQRLGHFAGWPGIAVAAMIGGQQLGQDFLLAGGAALLSRTIEERSGKEECDVVFGRAGGICSFLLAASLLNDSALVAFASTLGDELIAAAVPIGDGWGWKSPRHPKERAWTGFSHGASGIAFAFLQLAAATGQERFRAAARRAMRYERSVMDLQAANWPDFRGVKEGRGNRKQPTRCVSFWCHGAPGIALARIAAQSVLGDREWTQEAQLALGTTEAAFRQLLQSPVPNCSLCHGLLGLAEILELGGRTGMMELAAEAALATAARNSGVFTCDFAGETPPALMTGMAGVGHFFLRLQDRGLASVLWPAATVCV
jgi:lantibiotic modifying enzyme